MKRTKFLIAGAAALTLTSGWAWAQEEGDDGDAGEFEVTMTLMSEDGDGQEDVTYEIELPTDEDGYIPSDEGVENSSSGRQTAFAAKDDGRAFGDDAKLLAEDNRDRFGRGGQAPDLDGLIPENVPPEIEEPPVDVPMP